VTHNFRKGTKKIALGEARTGLGEEERSFRLSQFSRDPKGDYGQGLYKGRSEKD